MSARFLKPRIPRRLCGIERNLVRWETGAAAGGECGFASTLAFGVTLKVHADAPLRPVKLPPATLLRKVDT